MKAVARGTVGTGGGAAGRGVARRRPRTVSLLAAVPLLLSLAACGGDPGGEDAGEAGVGTSAGDTAAARAGAGDTAAGGADTVAAADTVPEGDSRPLRAFRFRIRNRGGDTVVVVADAGAGTRTLDTVPPADSSEVRVETRASLLELRGRVGPGGEVPARSRYDLDRPFADTLLEFEVSPRPAAEDTAGG